MKRRNQLLFFALILGLSGCSSQLSYESGVLSQEETTNHRYDFLALSVDVPSDWYQVPKAMSEELNDLGRHMLSGDDAMFSAALEASAKRTFDVFAFTRFEPGAPVEFNGSVASAAEDISLAPGVKTGCDYLFHTQKILQASQMNITFPGECEELSINQKPFGMLKSSISAMGTEVSQDYYATVCKGMALTFVVTREAGEVSRAYSNIVNSIEFECPDDSI